MDDTILFNDGTRICMLKDGVRTDMESAYIENYIKNTRKASDRNAWKSQGFGARFRGDGIPDRLPDENIPSSVNGFAFEDDDTFFYSLDIGEMSGVFRKRKDSGGDDESHVVHAQDQKFYGMDFSPADNLLALSVQADAFSRSVAVLDSHTHDYRLLTEGDSLDDSPFFSRTARDIVLFSSAGIGRDRGGNFTEYGSSGIYSLNIFNNDIEEVLTKPGKSLFQPKEDADGNLYFIEAPAVKKHSVWDILLDILMIPVRLVMALFNFLEFFSVLFTGKGFSERTGGSNPARKDDLNAGKIFVEGNLVDADKNFRKNQRKRNEYAGIVPNSWKLVRREPGGRETQLFSGAVSYDIMPDGSIVLTNGKNIILLGSDGKSKKLCDAALCTRVKSKGQPTAGVNQMFDK